MTKKVKLIIYICAAIAVAGLSAWLLFGNNSTNVYNHGISPRPYKGNDDAKITVMEFSDFQCPFCKNAANQLNDLSVRYGDKVKFEFHYYPLTTIHPNAYNSALAAECANDQGKFWQLHDLMFANQSKLSKSDLKNYAGQIGVSDTSTFNSCLDTRAKKSVIDDDVVKGDALGIQGTPTFYINGVAVKDNSELEFLLSQKIQETYGA